MENGIYLAPEKVNLLLMAGDGDAALVYLWLAGGRTLPCPLSGQRLESAKQTLQRLGLCILREKPPVQDSRPTYDEATVAKHLQKKDFTALTGEVQRILGRILSTEELKCLLSIHQYLRMPADVISILVSYCVQRNRQRGVRAPSLRNIEREAYRWSDEGIDHVEAAVAFVRAQLARQSRHGHIAATLQLGERRLTQGEENYVNQWVDWGFPDEVIRMAYEKTCLNTGGLKWPYLHSILKSWHEKGLHTAAEIRAGDGSGKKPAPQKRAISDFERDAVRKLMEEQEG